MKCPTPCYLCGEIGELDQMTFWRACDCITTDGCSHGICRECDEEMDEEDDLDFTPEG